MQKIQKILLILFSLLFFTGCLATQQDIAGLKIEMNDMSRKVNENLQEGIKVNIKVRDEIVAEIDRLKQINAELRTNIDIQNRYINQISGKVDAGNTRFNDYKISEEHLQKINSKLEVIETKLFDILISTKVAIITKDKDIYDTARADFSRASYDLAIIGFKKIINEYPESQYFRQANYDLVVTLYTSNAWGKVIEQVDKFAEFLPPQDEFVSRIKLIKAKSLVKLEDDDRAVIIYQDIMKNYSESEDSKIAKDDLDRLRSNDLKIYEKARAYFREEEYQQAIAGFKKLIADYPESQYLKVAHFDLIVSLYMTESWQKVVEVAAQYLSSYPNEDSIPRMILIQAKSYVQLDKIDVAKELYDLIINKYPQLDEAQIAKDDLENLS
ncbi:MAG: outer membrane protein assembly factor BamD [bacterium]|nr:outer membrane protein assembly factor BamD [bacterium]